MGLEILLLLIRSQVVPEALEPGKRKKFCLRFCWVFLNDNRVLEDLGDVFLSDTSRWMVDGFVLSNCSPVVYLSSWSTNVRAHTGEVSYVIHKSIREYIVVGTQLRKR